LEGGGIFQVSLDQRGNIRLRSKGQKMVGLSEFALKSLIVTGKTAFQADDDGSIPFTRSNVFDGLELPVGAFRQVGCCLFRQLSAIRSRRPRFMVRLA
jgi:hypothetical protein